MECRIKNNKNICNCSYSSCSRMGVCCECLSYHKRMGELPACYFPDDVERTYDRSIGNFIKTYNSRKHL
jgi:hypothetical protein